MLRNADGGGGGCQLFRKKAKVQIETLLALRGGGWGGPISRKKSVM